MVKIIKYIGNSNNFDNWVFNREPEIRAALKAISPGQTFSLAGMTKSNEFSALSLKRGGLAEKCFGSSLPEYAADHQSAACAFAQTATQITLLSSLVPALQQAFDSGTPMSFVTIADNNDRRAPGQLNTFKSSTLRRRLERSFRNLKFDQRKASFAVASIEVSSSISDGVTFFEPHAHVIICGCNEDHVRAVFQRQLTRNQAANSRPLRIDDISRTPGNVLSYITKSHPDMRSGYTCDEGRKRSRDNGMRGDILREWLAWMADRQLGDLIFESGISLALRRRIVEADLRAEITELLEMHQRIVRQGQKQAV